MDCLRQRAIILSNKKKEKETEIEAKNDSMK